MNNLATTASILFHLFVECNLKPADISESKTWDYLIKDHDAFISAIKNTGVEFRIHHPTLDKRIDQDSIIVKIPFAFESIYIVCHKGFNEAKNEEYQYFMDRMTGVK